MAAHITDDYLYDAFGDTLLAGSTANSYRYDGRGGYQFDVDLAGYYLRARFYDTSSGRFRSRDLLPVGIGNSNLYLYALNNPANLTDPSGQKAAPQPYQCTSEVACWLALPYTGTDD